MSQAVAPRRTQAERREATRTRLIESAVHLIATEGLSAATTRRISDEAGVSQGAQTHHFPQRLDLLAATMEHLVVRRLASYENLNERLPADLAGRSRALLDLVWEDFSSDTFVVWVRLWVAAAEDPELAERLPELDQTLRRALLAEMVTVVGGMIDEATQRASADRLGIPVERIDTLFAFIVDSIAGLALRVHFEPRHRPPRTDPWPAHRGFLLHLLTGA